MTPGASYVGLGLPRAIKNPAGGLLWNGMKSLEAVVSDSAARTNSDVYNGNPALELMMATAMKQIRGAYGESYSRDFHSRE